MGIPKLKRRRLPRAAITVATVTATAAFNLLSAGSSFISLIRVALTRQEGENGKLHKALLEALIAADKKSESDSLDRFEALEAIDLKSDSLHIFEVPCIEHAAGPDLSELKARLERLAKGEIESRDFGTVILTSPEAAKVFADAWESVSPAKTLPVKIASVGKGTSVATAAGGFEVAFEPSLANAETLAAELPEHLGPRVLYAASAIAPGTLQKGLGARGFTVERLDTYTTQAVAVQSKEALALMSKTDVVTFGSPSAVHAWGQVCSSRPCAACIGSTSEKAAKECGFTRIYAPSKPGMPGWAEVAAKAIQDLRAEKT
eukprot:TRINITY_DN9620_c0_g1_i3.p1 TRINITY_DN9620_c0_g1~~TRINITY_DN9620_c0_g1_i3.p1  ORF type:complete len:318 (+),score=69.62 TRINITY_DN9620_c0_g1_i3:44-997(+)